MCFDVIWGGNDIEETASLLRQEGQKKTEQTISSVTGDIHPMVLTTKTKFEKQSMNNYGLKLVLTINTVKATHDKFCKDQASPVQNFKGTNVEEFLKKMVQYEGFLKNEYTKFHATHELHTSRISKDDNSFSILRKSIGSFLVRDDAFGPNYE